MAEPCLNPGLPDSMVFDFFHSAMFSALAVILPTRPYFFLECFVCYYSVAAMMFYRGQEANHTFNSFDFSVSHIGKVDQLSVILLSACLLF